ncbi:hypothetical protein GCM10009601_14970 [Streptomyces thermospinosisporus]|uniref:Uncharacterized protein n=1 Tax=Streptomyces thermospinosisporus TaxID=161482 RepID=A0ABP4JCQ0_9ACTN
MTTMRAWAIGGSVVLAGAVNVATGMLTQNWSVAWGACAAVLVLFSAALAVWRARSEGTPSPPGSPPGPSQDIQRVKSGGSVRVSMNGVAGNQKTRRLDAAGDVTIEQND